MTKEYADYLAHHGIKGQKWGVRRFQDEDGSLTSQGKKRYENLTPRQRSQYNTLHPHWKKMIDKRMAEGKSYTQAYKEMQRRANTTAAVAVGILAATPALSVLASMGMSKLAKVGVRAVKAAVTKVKNTQIYHNFMNRVKARKTGDIVLGKKDYSIGDPPLPFGGFLNGRVKR